MFWISFQTVRYQPHISKPINPVDYIQSVYFITSIKMKE